MLNYISQNLANIITGTIILAAITAAVAKIIKDKKNHKSSCACGCANCPSAGRCREKVIK